MAASAVTPAPVPLLTRVRQFVPAIVLVVVFAVIGAVAPSFLSIDNLVRIMNASAIPLCLALGATFIILMGSIDLSVEGVVAMGAVVAALLVANDSNTNNFSFLAIPIVLAMGAAFGFVNGFVHVRLQIPSFMVTLGMSFIAIGIATVMLAGERVRILDTAFRELALARFLGLPLGIWIAALATLVAYIIQTRTRLGRWIYAVGGGEDILRLTSVPVGRVRILAFTLAGMFYGLGGVLAAAQLGQGHALMGQGRLFTTITAVVVGGTSLMGGLGGVQNTVIGVLIVIGLNNGMVQMGVPPYVQTGVQGILIIAAVTMAIDRSRARIVK
ncbi:MAG TPA: ABC transporter permease [Geminicoccus sp.]|jgi:ribose transport system permease protein|uniref:ABC transporter permease n=1 Tax=Geminicoccus sp. TaxID=2024832 RepID=UPI002E352E78|nr:ABC transporter permease [Geminicoccus sp.]HEX2527146.1 ABC transporter permease [Geminicoccus sp.]